MTTILQFNLYICIYFFYVLKFYMVYCLYNKKISLYMWCVVFVYLFSVINLRALIAGVGSHRHNHIIRVILNRYKFNVL